MSGVMYKIGICGHFGRGYNLLNGQTIKTKILTEELGKLLGECNIYTVDTYGWKCNPLMMLFRCYSLIKKCENIIVLPAHNGVKVFIPLFLMLNKIFHRKLHYVVIGGWLPNLLKDNPRLKRRVNELDGVYVETIFVKEELKLLGVNNAVLLTNFKRLNILDEKELVYSKELPYKLCTFSRVTDKKGIEDAVEVITSINKSMGKTVYALDIYGSIDVRYMERFEQLKQAFPDFVHYKGTVDFNESVNTLKNYFLLLFPTRYQTEGVPGTIIDAYAAGVPVIASEWNSAKEIVIIGETGFVYQFMRNDELEKVLLHILENPELTNAMKVKCINKAKQFTPEAVLSKFAKDAL